MIKKIIVNKFGGGILKKELMPFILKRINEQISQGFFPILVVSAMPKTTDSLVYFISLLREKGIFGEEAKALIKKYISEQKNTHNKIILDLGFDDTWQKKVLNDIDKIFSKLSDDLFTITVNSHTLEDKIVSYGEKLSCIILTHYLTFNKLPAIKLFAEEIPIITDDNFKNANIIYKLSERNVVKKLSKIKLIPIIAGFTGKTSNGMVTTLGRGGTDTTACFVGAAVRAHKVILWKDVGGVLSADPKIIPQAKTIPFVSYQEAEEAGKIIHDKAIQYAKFYGTLIEIASLENPKLKTEIGQSEKVQKGAKLVSYKKNLTLFIITDETIKGTEMFTIVSQSFSKNKVDVILISNTRYSLQIVAEDANGQAKKVFEELKKKFFKVEAHAVSMVFLIGNFDIKDVNDFNTLLIKLKTDLEISAFLYKNCTRLEAVIRTEEIGSVINELYKKFIK